MLFVRDVVVNGGGCCGGEVCCFCCWNCWGCFVCFVFLGWLGGCWVGDFG